MEPSRNEGERYLATMGVIVGASMNEINRFLDFNRLNRMCFRRVSTFDRLLGLPRNSVVWILNVRRVDIKLLALAENRFDHINYLED